MTWLIGGGVLGGGSNVVSPIVYIGVSPTLSVTGVGFYPDLVWIKKRAGTNPHILCDTTRGVNSQLSSNSSQGQTTDSNNITSFDSNGFSLGSDSNVNGDGQSHVAWCFKKDPKVFDIVGYTGTGSAHTEAHNMTVAPEMVIVKNLTAPVAWAVYHADLNGGTTPAEYFLNLDDTGAEAAEAIIWNDTAPTSSVFSVGVSSNTNQSGHNYIAYLFASKAGASKVGSYSGTGVAGNAITGLGFSPKFVMIKRRDAVANWVIYDSARGDDLRLYPDQFDIEGTNDFSLDSDGFTCNDGGGNTNASGTNNYIYLAMA